MRCRLEIMNGRAELASANDLVYAPLAAAPSYRNTRVYDIEYSGDEERLKRFVSDVLVDDVVETPVFGRATTHAEATRAIDVSLKPGVLDLEREYIMDYARRAGADNLDIHGLRIIRRYYFFGECGQAIIDRIVHDLVNPVIEEWQAAHD